MPNHKSAGKNTNSKYIATSELERLSSVLGNLTQDAQTTNDLLVNDSIDDSPVLTMSSLALPLPWRIGQLGRFANQLFQYAFLRICAQKSGTRVECPAWVGQTLFGHQDAPISHRLPPAIEIKDRDAEQSLFDVVPAFIPYIEKLANAKSSRVGSDALNTGLANADLWGFFQSHTRHFKPHQEYFRSLFQPVDDLKLVLDDGLNLLRSKGKTIVGIHLRRSDYLTEPGLGFTLVFPTKYYCEWLAGIWSELEDPVLLLCSDDLDGILDDFAKFSPVTTRDLKIQLPVRMEGLDFYTDFYMLIQCDVVCISNSNFSFMACMLNQQAQMFVRPHWDFSSRFISFDPWDSNPILYAGQPPRFLKSLPDLIRVTYTTQGMLGMLKSVLMYFPASVIKGWLLRAYLRYKVNGIIGAIGYF